MRRITLLAVTATAVGCVGEVEQVEEPSWELVATSTGALIDSEHPERGVYPNPSEWSALKVRLTNLGELCAESPNGSFCGGPLQGIPFISRLRIVGTEVCLRVVDIFGNQVHDRCGVQTLSATVEAAAADGATCYAATNADGNPCAICADDAGQVTQNTCQAGAGTDPGSDPGSDPADPATDPGADPGATGDACDSHEAAFTEGFENMLAEANEGLARMGLVGIVVSSPPDLSTRIPPEDENALFSLCEWAPRVPRWPEDSPSFVYGDAARDECVNQGRCRVAQMIQLATIEACGQLLACREPSQEQGIIAAGAYVLKQICAEEPQYPNNPPSDGSDPGDGTPGDGDDGTPGDGTPDDNDDGDGPVLLSTSLPNGRPFICRGSPLVVDVEGDGIALRGPEAGSTFALVDHLPMQSGWLRGSDDALLALDLDESGSIDSGRELFGETSDGFAPDGFSALARHDDDGNGRIDAKDAVYQRLLLWRDDGDARSEAGELSSLASAGIDSIAVNARKLGELDAHGNELGLAASVTLKDGSERSVTDVWFRMRPSADDTLAMCQ